MTARNGPNNKAFDGRRPLWTDKYIMVIRSENFDNNFNILIFLKCLSIYLILIYNYFKTILYKCNEKYMSVKENLFSAY